MTLQIIKHFPAPRYDPRILGFFYLPFLTAREAMKSAVVKRKKILDFAISIIPAK